MTADPSSSRATSGATPPELWAPRYDSSRPLQSKYYILVFAALLSFLCGQLPAQVMSNVDRRPIAIPDGTPVELRFAQPVVGSGSNARRDAQDPETAQAEAEDKVRLVAAGDVRLGGAVLIAKGAIAQATITRVKSTLRSFSSGIELRLDWIENTAGQKLPLRAERDGKPEGVMIVIRKTAAGIIAGPETRSKTHLFTGEFRNAGKESIPVGSRIVGYLQGSASIDPTDLTSPDAQIPATLTVYQLHRGSNSGVQVECDGRIVGVIGPQQYIVLNLPPGKHSCRTPDGKALDIQLDADAEYFVRIESKDRGLIAVSVGEGEDAIAGMQLVK